MVASAFSLMLSEQSSLIPINHWFSFVFHERKYVKCQWFLEYKHTLKSIFSPQVSCPCSRLFYRHTLACLSSFSIKRRPINISQLKNSVFSTVSQGSVLVYLILVPCFYELENVFLNQKIEKSAHRDRKLLATFPCSTDIST